jgi:nitroimidazol reductase NimA-like FMN-containing flavoprotein (pyridoxamine 5'-phosphate oxidase superfamily)
MDKHSETYAFLDSHTLGVLSTTTRQAAPFGAAIYYVVDQALNFFFLTHVTSQKYKNIHENQKAAFTVVDNYAQTTVQANGVVSEVAAGDEHDEAYRKLALVHPPGQFAWIPPVSKIHEGEIRLLKLTPQSLRFSNFSPEKASDPQIKEII